MIILNFGFLRKILRNFNFAKIFPSHSRCYVINLIQRNLFLIDSFIFWNIAKKRTTSPLLKSLEIFAKLMIFLSPFPNTYYIVLSIICLCPPDNVKCKSNEKILLDNYISLTSIRTRFARQMWDDVSYKSTGPLYTLIIC